MNKTVMVYRYPDGSFVTESFLDPSIAMAMGGKMVDECGASNFDMFIPNTWPEAKKVKYYQLHYEKHDGVGFFHSRILFSYDEAKRIGNTLVEMHKVKSYDILSYIGMVDGSS